MSEVKWSEWTNWNSIDKPPTLHSNTRIQAVNDEGYTLGEGNWQFTARDCAWEEITAYRYQLTDQPEVTDAEEKEWQRMEKEQSKSDGSTASYYELPEGCTELQDLISYRNMNAQDGEIFRAIYRKGRASHSDALRDARKVLFYAEAEVKRLERYCIG